MKSSPNPHRGRGSISTGSLLAAVLAATSATGGCRCDDELQATTARLQSDPASVDFGGVAAGRNRSLDLLLASTGTGPVTILDLMVEGDAAEVFIIEESVPGGFVLGAGSRRAISLRFEPAEKIDYQAELVVQSSDPESPLRVALVGSGLTPAIQLCLAPISDPFHGELDCAEHGESIELDFGVALGGRSVSRVVGVRNGGEASLLIEGAEFSETAWDHGFGALASTGLAVLEPGAEARLPLGFYGSEQGPVTGRLTFTSSDLEHPEVHVELVGDGVANTAPRACAGVSKIFHLDGSLEDFEPAAAGSFKAELQDRFVFTSHPAEDCSFDAEDGRLLTYEWRLTQAPESFTGAFRNPHSGPAVDLPEGTPPQNPPSLDISAVGIYRVELLVFDSLGAASSPVEIEIDARPEDELIVQLGWKQRADLDIHLIPPGASPLCELTCFWDSCRTTDEGEATLAWGAVPSSDDPAVLVIGDDNDPQTDPRLIFDNQGDTTVRDSPDLRLETIAVALLPRVDPALGPYRIGVHYFHAPRSTSGAIILQEPIEASVEIISQGEVVYTTTHTFAPDDEGLFWMAGTFGVDGDELLGEPIEGETFEELGYVGPPGTCE